MPETPSVAFLAQAKKDRNLAVEDFRDAFGVTHEAAAMRMTNLLTHHFGIRLHFLRVDGSGALMRVYENDDLPLPMDVTGSIEGQIVCRRFSARSAFAQQNRTTEHYQYTDTPAGTFWCSTQTGATDAGEFSITVGVPFDDARWFRGRETATRATSTCPDESCCRRPPAGRREPVERQGLAERPRAHAHVLAAPPRRLPGRRRQRGLRVPRSARRGLRSVHTGGLPESPPRGRRGRAKCGIRPTSPAQATYPLVMTSSPSAIATTGQLRASGHPFRPLRVELRGSSCPRSPTGATPGPASTASTPR